MNGKVHRVPGPFKKRGRLAGFDVEGPKPIEFRALVILRRKVRVALDDKQAALRVEIARDRMHDIGSRGEQLHHEARIAGLRDFALREGAGAAKENSKKCKRPAHHVKLRGWRKAAWFLLYHHHTSDATKNHSG